MKENDINQLCNVYDLCKSELIAGCVQASEKDFQELWKNCQQLSHSEKSDFRKNAEIILILAKLLSEKSELLEKTEKLETEVAELRARLEKAVELPRIIHPNPVEWHIQYQYESGIITEDIRFSEAKAEARLKELQGGER